MFLCHCLCLTEEEIQSAILAGAFSLADLTAFCGAGSECGSCVGELRCLLEKKKARSEQTPRPYRPASFRTEVAAVSGAVEEVPSHS